MTELFRHSACSLHRCYSYCFGIWDYIDPADFVPQGRLMPARHAVPGLGHDKTFVSCKDTSSSTGPDHPCRPISTIATRHIPPMSRAADFFPLKC